MGAERRIFRVSAGDVAEAVLVRAAGSTETTDAFTVPSSKTLRITDSELSTQQSSVNTIIRLREGTTTAGQEIRRFVLSAAQTLAIDSRVPFRVDGGNNGQSLVLTSEQPGASPAVAVSALLMGQQD